MASMKFPLNIDIVPRALLSYHFAWVDSAMKGLTHEMATQIFKINIVVFFLFPGTNSSLVTKGLCYRTQYVRLTCTVKL